MNQLKLLRLGVSILVCCLLQAHGADKYTDGNRPYEFGFKIDGQQHRHESKDEDGIIMGEFGFVTADDVYHVTVYATDKEGRFKILSMKNIHLKSSPAISTPTSARQGHSLALPPAQAAPVQTQIAPQAPAAPQPGKPLSVSIEPPGRSCSSCSLPTTTTPAPPRTYNQAVNSNSPSGPLGSQNNGGLGGPSYNPQGGQTNYPQPNSGISQNYPQQGPGAPADIPAYVQPAGQSVQNYPSSPNYAQSPNAPNYPTNYNQPGASVAGQQPGVTQTYTEEQNSLNNGGGGSYAGPNGQSPSQPSSPQGFRTSNQYNPPEQPFDSYPNEPQGPGSAPSRQSGPAKPTLVSAQPQGFRTSKQYNPPEQPFNSYPNEPQGPGSAPSRQSGPAKPTLVSAQPQGFRTSKQYNPPEQPFDSYPNELQGPGSAPSRQSGPAKPTLVSAQMQIVDKNTDVHALGPGERKGLPPGLTRDDMTTLLYTFNYTVGFHGHFEEGYTNGVKKGYYFVTGRNGVRTRIDYVADDSGFHPKVSQEVLDLLSEDVPKPETEKDEKYGLKGYEFKWLYYPTDSKK